MLVNIPRQHEIRIPELLEFRACGFPAPYALLYAMLYVQYWLYT